MKPFLIAFCFGLLLFAQDQPAAPKVPEKFTADELKDVSAAALRARISELEQQLGELQLRLGQAHAEIERLNQQELREEICRGHKIDPDACLVDGKAQTVGEKPPEHKPPDQAKK